MPYPLSADDLMPLVASLPDSERIKLLKRIATSRSVEPAAYSTAPPTPDEFSSDNDQLAWDTEGWDEFR